MPRRLIPLLLLLLSLLPVGCASRASRSGMDRAEALMDSLPDSALAILRAIDPATLATPFDDEPRARHALLLSQALDKNCIDIADDSLISIAYDHYALDMKHQLQRAQTFYYRGVIDFNGENYNSAIYYLSIADTLAAMASIPELRGKSNAMIALALSELTLLELEYEYSLKSLRYFEEAEDSVRAAKQRLNVAVCCVQLGEYDNALALLNQTNCAQSNIIRALALLSLNRLDEFHELYLKDTSLVRNSKIQSRYSVALDRHNMLNEARAALFEAYKYARNRYDTASCLIAKSELLRREGEWLEYSRCVDSVNRITNASLVRLKGISTPVGITNAQTYIGGIEAIRSKRLRDNLIASLVIGALTTFIACSWAIILHRKRRKAKEEYDTSIALLKAEYDEEVKKNASERHNYALSNFQEVVKTKSRLIALCQSYMTIPSSDRQKATTIKREIQNLLTPELLLSLEQYLNHTSNSLIQRVRKIGIDGDDLKILLLSKSGFSNRQIEILTGHTYNSVASRKYRVTVKLRSEGLISEDVTSASNCDAKNIDR